MFGNGFGIVDAWKVGCEIEPTTEKVTEAGLISAALFGAAKIANDKLNTNTEPKKKKKHKKKKKELPAIDDTQLTVVEEG